MQPNDFEIEEVINAFVSLRAQDYSAEQQSFLSRFLRFDALDLNENEINKAFTDKIHVIDNLKTLNQFATHYQNESQIYVEFQNEIEDLLITLNGTEGGLQI